MMILEVWIDVLPGTGKAWYTGHTMQYDLHHQDWGFQLDEPQY